ncbi:MAG: hypothetical protein A2Z20_03040 [Bdellovibrionales bacterium RBG_16_40_8]|nr:MAG: hypothetical protein A2Z20_03040 [Bdellovibrionales bacterium RBG_16_40_8]
MQRVILVIDDYNELLYVQTLLKKLGFDVEGLQNVKKYADVSLGFNPHVLITTCRGSKVDGLFLAKSINKKRGMPKIIGLKTSDLTISEEELNESGIDILIESPISPNKLIQTLSQIADLDERALLDKYSKIKGYLPQESSTDSNYLFDENGQPIEDSQKIKSAIAELTGPTTMSRSSKSQTIAAGENAIKDQAKFNLKSPQEEAEIVDQNKNNSERQERFSDWIKKNGPLTNKSLDRNKIREFNKKMRAVPLPDDTEIIENEKKKFVESLFKK